jgi:excisionase family DNA binding protein
MRDKTIYTTKDVADLAAQYGRPVTQEYIRRLCKSGRIQAVRPSRDWLIAASEAMRWLASWLKG